MSKQKLIIVAGSPCVGKTTVTEKLFASYENSDPVFSIDREMFLHSKR